MTFSRLIGMPLLLALAAALIACDAGDGTSGTDTTRIEDLTPDGRMVMNEDGAFDGTAEEFLAQIPFEPFYPSDVPEGFELSHASILPSLFARDGDDPLAELWLEYRRDGGDTDWVTVTQRMQRMEVGAGVPTQTVDVGAFEGVVVDLPRSEAIQLFAYACELTVTLTSHVLSEDELIAMAASMTEDCEDPTEG